MTVDVGVHRKHPRGLFIQCCANCGVVLNTNHEAECRPPYRYEYVWFVAQPDGVRNARQS